MIMSFLIQGLLGRDGLSSYHWWQSWFLMESGVMPSLPALHMTRTLMVLGRTTRKRFRLTMSGKLTLRNQANIDLGHTVHSTVHSLCLLYTHVRTRDTFSSSCRVSQHGIKVLTLHCNTLPLLRGAWGSQCHYDTCLLCIIFRPIAGWQLQCLLMRWPPHQTMASKLPPVWCTRQALLHAGSVGVGLLLLRLGLPGSVPVYCQPPGVVGGAVRALQAQYVERHVCKQARRIPSVFSFHFHFSGGRFSRRVKWASSLLTFQIWYRFLFLWGSFMRCFTD